MLSLLTSMLIGLAYNHVRLPQSSTTEHQK